jgi:hypothetical protein
MEKRTGTKAYEPPQVKDLSELSLYGQWPLATHTCVLGSGTYQDHTCSVGSDPATCATGDAGNA